MVSILGAECNAFVWPKGEVHEDEDEEMQSVVSSGEEVPRPRVGGDDDDSEEGVFSLLYLYTI